MAQNDDFYKVLAKGVTLQWPRLNSTHRYNTAKKQSEPCAPTAQGASWSVSWQMPAAEARKLHAELKAHYDACRTRNTKLPEFSKIFGMKVSDDKQTVSFTAKRNGVKGDGSANSAPKVIDGQKNPLADLGIWGGSVGTVRAWAYPAVDPDGMGGISMILDAVQVTEAVYGGGGLDDFDDVGPSASSSSDPFDSTPKAVVQAAQKSTIAADLGDDIPF